ncbi:TetR/AcrR family transcriptional regulator [Microbacterium terrae]|uniref:Bacterial regulatory protein, tetR family n=2 Tax=Microbacterium terrae TaxID=69369 RepID=A0A0M2GVK6_9MICO|nr:Bacterial regulatory protein, tetR family [Microbacterium terrae]GLJ97206.1 TetR family transcriptional regulator [Microbacterium terrae]
MRTELLAAAFAVILEHGYDDLTADELARSLGISRASFFRHLGSKDDVIVSVMLGPTAQFADALRDAPRDSGESTWRQLRAAFEPSVTAAEAAPDLQRKRMRLIQSIPAVGARLQGARGPQIEALAEVLAERGTEPFAAEVLSTAAVAALDRCWARWIRTDSHSLRTILDRAFAELDAAARPSPPG